jgi:hypothetical protein
MPGVGVGKVQLESDSVLGGALASPATLNDGDVGTGSTLGRPPEVVDGTTAV